MNKFMFIVPTLSNGGAERVVSVISGALVKSGQNVVVVKYYSVDNEYSIDDGVKVVNLSGGEKTEYTALSYLKKVRKLRKIIKDNKPDFVIPFLFNVALCTFFASFGLKTTVMQSLRIDPAIAPKTIVKRIIRDFLVYISKCVFVQNQQQKQYFKKRAHKKIHILYNPVSEELFEAQPHFNNDIYTVCAVGRLENQKNYPLLINAFKKAFEDKKARLLIYGEGSKRRELEVLIDDLGIKENVYLMGRTDNIKSVYENADLYVLSSDFEGMPNALIEAMACGLPCISTDCPTGPADLIENGKNGWLVPVRDVEALSNTMKKAFLLKDKTIELTKEGRNTIKDKCIPSNIANQMIEICSGIKEK